MKKHMICQLEKEFYFSHSLYLFRFVRILRKNLSKAKWNEVKIAKACTNKSGNAIPKGWTDIKVSLSVSFPAHMISYFILLSFHFPFYWYVYEMAKDVLAACYGSFFLLMLLLFFLSLLICQLKQIEVKKFFIRAQRNVIVYIRTCRVAGFPNDVYSLDLYVFMHSIDANPTRKSFLQFSMNLTECLFHSNNGKTQRQTQNK